MPSWALAIVAAALAGAIHLLFALNGYTGLGDDIPSMGLWRCLAGFAMGCVMCQLWQRWQKLPRGGVYAGLAFVSFAAAGLALGLPETAWVPATFFTGLLALALGRGPLVQLLGGKVLTYLGEISYSTYLAHFLLFILFKLAFVDASLQLGWGGLAGFLALVLGASIALYHGLEKPAQRWLNARPPRWAVRPLPALAE
jgi:peptidoglycan/LPS O-acetylase OafA/YrhL